MTAAALAMSPSTATQPTTAAMPRVAAAMRCTAAALSSRKEGLNSKSSGG